MKAPIAAIAIGLLVGSPIAAVSLWSAGETYHLWQPAPTTTWSAGIYSNLSLCGNYGCGPLFPVAAPFVNQANLWIVEAETESGPSGALSGAIFQIDGSTSVVMNPTFFACSPYSAYDAITGSIVAVPCGLGGTNFSIVLYDWQLHRVVESLQFRGAPCYYAVYVDSPSKVVYCVAGPSWGGYGAPPGSFYLLGLNSTTGVQVSNVSLPHIAEWPQSTWWDATTNSLLLVTDGDSTVERIDPSTGGVTPLVHLGGWLVATGLDLSSGLLYVGTDADRNNTSSSLLSVVNVSSEKLSSQLQIGGTDSTIWVDSRDGLAYAPGLCGRFAGFSVIELSPLRQSGCLSAGYTWEEGIIGYDPFANTFMTSEGPSPTPAALWRIIPQNSTAFPFETAPVFGRSLPFAIGVTGFVVGAALVLVVWGRGRKRIPMTRWQAIQRLEGEGLDPSLLD